jgi:hypothetical protein
VQLLECCKAIWALVTQTTGLDMKLVGVHVWTIRGPKGVRHLERRATFTIVQRRRTPVTWNKGR